MWSEVAVLFNIQPWQMVRLPALKRMWYEQAAMRHREHEAARWQQILEVVGEMLGG